MAKGSRANPAIEIPAMMSWAQAAFGGRCEQQGKVLRFPARDGGKGGYVNPVQGIGGDWSFNRHFAYAGALAAYYGVGNGDFAAACDELRKQGHLPNGEGPAAPTPPALEEFETSSQADERRRERLEAAKPAMLAVQRAQEFFVRELETNSRAADAWDRLKEKGLTAATIRRFRLGYAPYVPFDKGLGPLGEALAEFDIDTLVEASLAGINDEGKPYPYHSHRITIPTFAVAPNGVAAVVSFSGRSAWANSRKATKHKHGRNTAWTSKSLEVFGLPQAMDRLAKGASELLVVEGQTDVMMCDQIGLAAVAGNGINLSAAVAKQLAGLGADVAIVFDGDEAGQRATASAAEALRLRLPAGGLTSVALPLDGQDPADRVRQDPEGFLALLAVRKEEN